MIAILIAISSMTGIACGFLLGWKCCKFAHERPDLKTSQPHHHPAPDASEAGALKI